MAGSIVVIRFKRPVDINVDRLSDAVPAYVGSARRDPDGSAIRLSLARRVTVNAMTAGERIFVDLLPDSWTGLPPSLPQEVIRELSERARVAERALRQQRAAEAALKRAPVRVRASVQPTFVRFVFELPDGASVSSALNEQKLALVFNTALTFDLADARLAAPSNVASINQKIEGESASVEVALIGDVDVHSFREDKNYIVDIGFQSEKPSPLASPAAPTPARPSDKPADEAPPQRSSDIVPPASETIAQQARLEPKPEPAMKPQAASAAGRPRLLRDRNQGDTGRGCCRIAAKNRARRRRAADGSQAGQCRRSGGCQAQQRRAAPDLFIRFGRTGSLVPPRRRGVAGFRFHKARRSRADPPRGRSADRRCQRAAAGERAGDPPAPQPSATGLADG